MNLVPYLSSTATPRATVLLIHGFGEHHRRYLPFISALNQRGYDVWTFDFTGHGHSPGPRARVDVARLIGEHLEARRELREVSRTEKTFLFGHSMGGLVTLASTLLDPSDLAATAVTGPALRPLPKVHPLLARFARAAGRIVPGFPTVELARDRLSHDPQVLIDLANDPLAFAGKVPLLTASSMIEQGARVIENAPMLSVPVLILHGSEDALADLEGSAEFVVAAPDQAEMIIVDGAYHEVLNELNGERSGQEIIDWYDRW